MRIWTNDVSVAAAHYWFCSDFHDGQGSRAYSLLSTHPYSPGPLINSIDDEPEDVQAYYYALLGQEDA